MTQTNDIAADVARVLELEKRAGNGSDWLYSEGGRTKEDEELENEAPLMAQVIRQLSAECEIMKAKISKYESDHPWAKTLQDMAEATVKENYVLRAVMEQARETLAFYGSWSDSDAAHPARHALAQLDAALGTKGGE